RSIFRRWETDAALVILSISRFPVLALFVLGCLKIALLNLHSPGIFQWIERGITALLIVALTFWIGQLFTQVIVYYLKDYARRTEAIWDDVLIPILQSIVPPLIYLFGTFFFLQTLGIDLTGLWVAFGGVTFVLGFALREILADFFSGLILLIDTPFQFGDMISLPNGSTAVIKKIGLRVTHLYLIDSHCEIYTPNSQLAAKDIVNLSRPTPHFAYSINLSVKPDADPVNTTNILREIVLGHPDTLGNLDAKLENLDKFTGFGDAKPGKMSKQEAGRLRLLAEKDVNQQLAKIETAFDELIAKIKVLEKGGLDVTEISILQSIYQDILKNVGLSAVINTKNKRGRSTLEELPAPDIESTLIGSIRIWYKIWLQDPDLLPEDETILPEEWEPKIELLKFKLTKLSNKISQPGGDETRLDDYGTSFLEWLRDNFKQSQTTWKEPQIRMTDIKINGIEFAVRFYVDNIKLEHWWRGNRVSNQLRREIVRRLRQAYIY
ncbi:MAG: mechanosensitive ion channel family protein, partial [Microcoleus sp.]